MLDGPNATLRVGRVRDFVSFEYSKFYVTALVTDGKKTYGSAIWSRPELGRAASREHDSGTPTRPILLNKDAFER